MRGDAEFEGRLWRTSLRIGASIILLTLVLVLAVAVGTAR